MEGPVEAAPVAALTGVLAAVPCLSFGVGGATAAPSSDTRLTEGLAGAPLDLFEGWEGCMVGANGVEGDLARLMKCVEGSVRVRWVSNKRAVRRLYRKEGRKEASAVRRRPFPENGPPRGAYSG